MEQPSREGCGRRERKGLGTPEKVVDAGNAKVLALGKISGRGRGTGLQVDMELHSLYTLVDGKITRVEGFLSRHEALEAAELRK